MRSYVSATLLKTPATRSLFSASVTVSNPKWVWRLDVSFEVASRAGVVAEKVRDGDGDIMAEPEPRFRKHDRTVVAPRPKKGLGAAIVKELTAFEEQREASRSVRLPQRRG